MHWPCDNDENFHSVERDLVSIHGPSLCHQRLEMLQKQQAEHVVRGGGLLTSHFLGVEGALGSQQK